MTSNNLPEKLSAAEALEERLDQLPALDTTEVVERTLNRILNGATAEAIFANP